MMNMQRLGLTKELILDGLGRSKEALNCYDQALNFKPYFITVFTNKGICLDELGRFDEAIKCFNRVLLITPQDKRALVSKGVSLDNLKLSVDAIKCYNSALEIDPKDAGTLYNKGVSLYDLKCIDDAIACYHSALQIDLKRTIMWSNSRMRHSHSGVNQLIISKANGDISINPSNADAWYKKAIGEDQIGRSFDALVAFKMFLQLAPANEQSKISVANKKLSKLYEN